MTKRREMSDESSSASVEKSADVRSSPSALRVALYGGTFDPVHVGHLTIARNLIALFALDEVLFVPAYVAPHKRAHPPTSAFHRYAMLALATQDEPRMRISTVELDAPERPYTVDTLAKFSEEFGARARLFFVIGADSWADIRAWRDWERLLLTNTILVVTRPGYALDKTHVTPEAQARVVDLRGASRERIEEVLAATKNAPHIFWTDAAMVDVSATEIRHGASLVFDTWDEEARAGAASAKDLAALVSPAVAAYIGKYNLYGKTHG